MQVSPTNYFRLQGGPRAGFDRAAVWPFDDRSSESVATAYYEAKRAAAQRLRGDAGPAKVVLYKPTTLLGPWQALPVVGVPGLDIQ